MRGFKQLRVIAMVIVIIVMAAFLTPIGESALKNSWLLESKVIFADAAGLTGIETANQLGTQETLLTIELESQFDMPTVRQKYVNQYADSNGELDAEGAESALRALRQECKEYYEILRAEYSEAHDLDIQTDISSPYIDITLDKGIKNVKDFNSKFASAIIDDRVAKAYVSNIYKNAEAEITVQGESGILSDDDEEYVTEEIILRQINAPDSYISNCISRIGIAEGGFDEELLPGLNITHNYGTALNDSHGTMVGKMASLIAPDAEYYYATNDTSDVQWMVDNGVHAVNISFTDYRENSIGWARILDKIAYDNAVNIVSTPGNSEGATGSPGIGYNVITVGASDVNGDDVAGSGDGDANLRMPVKPNIIAPGNNIYLEGFYEELYEKYKEEWARPYAYKLYEGKYPCGTSFAAPLVAATIAVMIEKEPSLCLYPETVRSILYSSADESVFPNYGMNGCGVRFKTGAGMLNVTKALESNPDFSCHVTNNAGVGKFILSYGYYLNKDEQIKACLSWLTDVDVEFSIFEAFETTGFALCLFMGNEEISRTEILYIDGNDIYKIYNNVAMLTYKAKSAGMYYIKILQETPLRYGSEYLSLVSNQTPIEPVEEGYRWSYAGGEVAWTAYSDNTAIIEGNLTFVGSTAWWFNFTFLDFEIISIDNSDCTVNMKDGYVLLFESCDSMYSSGVNFTIRLTGVALNPDKPDIISENSLAGTGFGGYSWIVYADGTAFVDGHFSFCGYGGFWFPDFTFTDYEVIFNNSNHELFMELNDRLMFEALDTETVCIVKLRGVVFN